LERLARVLGRVSYAGEVLPILEPLGDWRLAGWDFMEFDRQVCGLLHKFVRPVAPADLPTLTAGSDAEQVPAWILVEQLAPGIRRRVGVELTLPDCTAD
jgi:hypothetical protein